MKTVLKKSEPMGVFVIALALGIFVGGVTPIAAFAADASTPAAIPVAAPAVVPQSPALQAENIVPPSLPVVPVNEAKDGAQGKNITDLDTKTPDSVKDLLKRLENKTDGFNLDDLNSAKQAVAKIEALIDIEKHLAELEKVRQDREGKSLSSAIPASALAPMPAKVPQWTPPPAMAMPAGNPMPVSFGGMGNDVQVSRIIGADGHYSAMIATSDGGTAKTYHVGDHLTDSEIVTGITADGVELTQNGKKHVVHVKNVGSVFGGNP